MSIANHTVAVRSAENGTLGIDRLFTDINIAGKRDHWPASEDISLHVTLPYLTLPYLHSMELTIVHWTLCTITELPVSFVL